MNYKSTIVHPILYLIVSILFFNVLINPISGCKRTTISPSKTQLTTQEIIYANTLDRFKDMNPFIGDIILTLNKNEQTFNTGLTQLMTHDFADAVHTFLDLYNSNIDDTLKNEIPKILFDLYFNLSEWKQILLFDSLIHNKLEDEDNIMNMAKAYAFDEREYTVFHNDSSDIEFTTSPTGCPVVPCYINGKLYNLWFDTGANYSILSSDIAAECNIKPIITKPSKARTSTSRKINIYPAKADSLRIGGISIINSPFVIVNDFDLKLQFFGSHRKTKIDGILGWKAIKHFKTIINFNARKLSVLKPFELNNPLEKRNFFWLGCPFVKVHDTSGIVLNFGLDFGSQKSCITNNIFQKIQFEKIYRITKPKTSVGGEVYFNSKMVPSLSIILSNEEITFYDIGTTYQLPHLFTKLDGILGSDILDNSVVTIDILNGIFTVNYQAPD